MADYKFKTKREMVRAGQRFTQRTQTRLQDHISSFFKDAANQDETRIRELFAWYNKKWTDFATAQNKIKSFTVYGDAFESSIMNGYDRLKKAKLENAGKDVREQLRVLKLLKRKTAWERFVDRFKRKPGEQPRMKVV